MPERNEADSIAHDLSECRQRGLDWLDQRTRNQAPIPATALEQLAADYVAAKGMRTVGRIDQIKLLLRDGIEQFMPGHVVEATLIRDLFFGESVDGAIKPPGVLLKNASARFDEPARRFLDRRTNAMTLFANFLLELARQAELEPERQSEPQSEPEAPQLDSGDLGLYYQQEVTVRYADDSEHFVQMLARASRVTIVGLTNERLRRLLQEALRRKRASGRSDAFWDSLRIVFLARELLGVVNDEREDLKDSAEALRQRSQAAFWANKSIGAFLKRTQSSRWALYESPYMPALTGSLFEFDDRKKIVHLLIRRTRRPPSENLYIELEDRAEQFSMVFDDVVKSSASNVNVPAGIPVDRVFHCTGWRLHSNVLKDGSGAGGWLPMVLVVTTRHRGRQVEPILQLRTAENSAREINCLSHLGGHILQKDWPHPREQKAVGGWIFSLTDVIPARAATRLVTEVAETDPGGRLRPVTTGSYLYPDKEHLFFFIFSLELPDNAQFPRPAEMHAFPLAELVAIRANQVLRSAVKLCLTPVRSAQIWRAAAEILAQNMSLHDHGELGDMLLNLTDKPRAERAAAADYIGGLVTEQATPSWALGSSEFQPAGLAGWQFREFFRVLLPLYARINVDGAAELIREVQGDRAKAAAVERLYQLYQNEDLMLHMPIEL